MSDSITSSNPNRRSEVVDILATSLLQLLLAGTEHSQTKGRKPLISGSQPALLGGEDGAAKPRTRGLR